MASALPARAEVVVVGGGVMGVAIAHELAAKGCADVVVLERDGLASGPTGRSTAIIRQHYSQALLIRMATRGLEVYRAFPDAVGASSGFTRAGMLVVTDPADRAALEHNVALGRTEGAATELLSAGQVRELDPRLDTSGELLFCFESEAGSCDPYLVTAGYAAAARRAGVAIKEGVQVESVTSGTVRTHRGSIAAGTVVVAAGPWSAPLLEPLGYELPITCARAEVGRFRLPDEFGPAPVIVADFSALELYFKPAAEPGFLEVGSLDSSHAARPIDPDRCPDGADRETLTGFQEGLARRLRGVEGGHWRGSWSAVYDVTPDWHPAIGAVPGAEGVIVAAGFSGHGFKLAPAVGTVVAELVLDERSHTYDVELLDPGRFEREDLVGTAYGYSVLG